jgi:hypothetical protein
MSLSWSNLLIGRRIANREAEGRKLGVLTGVPAMGLDGLGSASYGPEAALTILAATGASGLGAFPSYILTFWCSRSINFSIQRAERRPQVFASPLMRCITS